MNVTALVNTVIEAALAVIKVAEPTAPWLGSLAAAISALEQAEQQWKAGGAVTIIIDALNTIEQVLAVIPLTAAYSPLIDVLVAGIEAVFASLGVSAPASVAARPVVGNPHRGRAALSKPHFLQNEVGAFKEQWNKVVAANAALAPAKL